MRRLVLIILVSCHVLLGYGQTEDKAVVTYRDSVSSYMPSSTFSLEQRVQNAPKEESTAFLYSRKKKFRVEYDDNYFVTDGVIRCLKMAIDTWEDKIEIGNMVCFNLTISEELDPDIEIQTDVLYSRRNREAVPSSLYFHNSDTEDIESNGSAGSIMINANIDWSSSWAYDNYIGNDNLATALLRHIAHILGFGTTIVEQNGGLRFAINRAPSKFDTLVNNGKKQLSSCISTTDLESFFRGNLYLDLSDTDYPLYCSSDGYVPYRTGNYFHLDKDNILNYPYGDRTELLPINKETLDVMEAIGWTVVPHDVKIEGTDLDATGYGSVYLPHTFRAVSESGNEIGNAIWKYQLYDGKSYVDKKSVTGSAFTITPEIAGDKYVDDFGCLQARVVCTVSVSGTTRQYTYPLCLETRPHFIGYEISNVKETPGTNYFNFDIKLRHIGADSGSLYVCNEFGSALYYSISPASGETIHVSQVYKYGLLYLDITLYNDFGSTVRRFYLNDYPNISNRAGTETSISEPLTDTSEKVIYTLQGFKLQTVTDLKSLPKGTYIIKKPEESWKGRIYIVRSG